MAKKQKQEKKVAVIYARYSSHAQNDQSIEQQVEKCTAYAERLGVQITHVYADRAMTGKNDRRPEFQKMLADAEKGLFNLVIAWKSNRIGRNMIEALVNDGKLISCGVETKYVEEDFDDSAAGRFALRSMMNLNQFYSENMAEDIRRGLEDAAKQTKVVCSMPYGYKKDPETGQHVIDEPKADIVREIFKRFNDGEPLIVIAEDLNRRGIRTNRNGLWNKGSFHRMLSCERYKGTYIWGDVRIENGMPAIIDEETYERTQRKLATRGGVAGKRREYMPDYLLTGYLYCGHCKGPMIGHRGTSKNGTNHYYYVCQTRYVKKACDKEHIRKDVIEKLVASLLMQRVISRDDVIEHITDQVMAYQKKLQENSELELLKTRLEESKSALRNLMKAIESGLAGDMVNARAAELQADIADTTALIDKTVRCTSHFTREQVQYYLERYREGDIENEAFLKALFRQYLNRVYLYDDKITIDFNYIEGSNELECSLELPDSPPYMIDANTFLHYNGRSFVLEFFF